MNTLTSSRSLRLAVFLGLAIFQLFTGPKCAQAQAAASAHGRILLVLPFDNRTGQPSLEWIREASAEILSSRLASAGFAPMSRADRIYALDHLGLPQAFHPSRATSLKLAETLDADSIIVGSYVTDGSGILAEAQLVDVPHLRISEAVTARGEMGQMVAVFDSLAWRLTRQLDPGFNVSEETFVAAGSTLRLNAFEQYIRGITETDQTERLRHLNSAVVLNPEFSPAWMALGREEYASQQYEQAAAAFAKVEAENPESTDALEAGFLRGLSLLFSGDYVRAGDAFARVARVLPLAEVLNNQGVALARRGLDGSALFRQAQVTDPNGADYHFNLAVSLKRHGDKAEALNELAQCLKLKPNDGEAVELEQSWSSAARSSAAKAPVVKPALGAGESPETAVEAKPKPDPLERIERSFDAVAFHQAALMVEAVEAQRLAQLRPQERAQKLAAQAREYLEHGLLLEAERLYQSALAADSRNPAAHAGLAEVRERTGDIQAARKEAVTSLQLMPSVEAYMVLGRLDLAAGHMDQVIYETGEALKIDPKNQQVLALKQQIEDRKERK